MNRTIGTGPGSFSDGPFHPTKPVPLPGGTIQLTRPSVRFDHLDKLHPPTIPTKTASELKFQIVTLSLGDLNYQIECIHLRLKRGKDVRFGLLSYASNHEFSFCIAGCECAVCVDQSWC